MENLIKVIKFIFITISKEDEWEDRRLSPINLVKYVYLADLFYAQRNEGNIFTGVAWKFHHYGPWDSSILIQAKKVAQEMEVEVKQFSSTKFEDDYERFCIKNLSWYEEFEKNIVPVEIAVYLPNIIKKFGNGTSDLLDMVYKTKPMLNAAPEDYLDFTTDIIPKLTKQLLNEPNKKIEPISKSYAKKMEEKYLDFKKRLNAQLQIDIQKRDAKKAANKPSTVDSEQYEEYMNWLDSLEGNPEFDLQKEGIIEFGPEIWKSSLRKAPDELC
jgi:hypothetical protein